MVDEKVVEPLASMSPWWRHEKIALQILFRLACHPLPPRLTQCRMKSIKSHDDEQQHKNHLSLTSVFTSTSIQQSTAETTAITAPCHHASLYRKQLVVEYEVEPNPVSRMCLA